MARLPRRPGLPGRTLPVNQRTLADRSHRALAAVYPSRHFAELRLSRILRGSPRFAIPFLFFSSSPTSILHSGFSRFLSPRSYTIQFIFSYSSPTSFLYHHSTFSHPYTAALNHRLPFTPLPFPFSHSFIRAWQLEDSGPACQDIKLVGPTYRRIGGALCAVYPSHCFDRFYISFLPAALTSHSCSFFLYCLIFSLRSGCNPPTPLPFFP
jgi:hypothetical protein